MLEVRRLIDTNAKPAISIDGTTVVGTSATLANPTYPIDHVEMYNGTSGWAFYAVWKFYLKSGTVISCTNVTVASTDHQIFIPIDV